MRIFTKSMKPDTDLGIAERMSYTVSYTHLRIKNPKWILKYKNIKYKSQQEEKQK